MYIKIESREGKEDKSIGNREGQTKKEGEGRMNRGYIENGEKETEITIYPLHYCRGG